MDLEKKKAFLLNVIFIIFVLGIGYVVIKYVLPLLMPFIIGLIIAVVFRRIIDYLEKKLRINRSLVSVIVLVIFYGVLILILSMISARVFTFLKDLFGQLPDLYRYTIEPALEKIANNLMEQFPDIRPYAEEFILNISDTLFSFVKNASTTVIATITGLAGKLPSLLIKLIFTVVSSFFFTIDYYKISDFVLRQFKGERRKMVLRLKDDGIGTIVKFIKAYSAIISITFIELSVDSGF